MRIVDPRDKNGNRLLVEKDLEGFQKNAYENIRKISDYLYEVWYDSLDYDYGFKVYEEKTENVPAQCSAVRKGNYYGRNFDWVFNEQAEFIVHTPSKCGRYATLGTASAVGSLTEDVVSSRSYNKDYRFLPFKTVDGINEKGLVMNTNVVPAGDKGYNSRVYPKEEKLLTINGRMVIRYVLDNFATATEAIDFLQNHAEIFLPSELTKDHGYELHYMIADTEGTWILEFIEGSLEATKVGEGESHPAVMTNFHIHGTVLNEGETRERVGYFYSPKYSTTEHYPSRDNGITPHAAGVERYNILARTLESCEESFEGIQNAMQSVKYTLAYDINSQNPWYSEYVGYPTTVEMIETTTIDSPPMDFALSMQVSRRYYEEDMENEKKGRERARIWQTVHSIVYDMNTKEARILVQERGEYLPFNFEMK